MKKLIALSLAIIMICSTFVGCSLFAKDKEDNSSQIKYSEGLEFILSNDGESYWLKGMGSCTDTEIVIPSTYNNLPVTGICDDAFRDQTSITSVVIPDSVTSISTGAFTNCASLASVVIGNSVEFICFQAFAGCNSLTSIVIPSSVTRMEPGVFVGCTSLKKVIFEDPSNWGCGEYEYDPIYDIYRWVVIPIEEDFSNPEIAAQLLTSTYVNEFLDRIK